MNKVYKKLKIDKGSKVPRYHQLFTQLKELALKGELSVGEKLLSDNEFMTMLTLSRSTVRQALHELEKAGIIRREHGKGTFIKAVPGQEDRTEGYIAFFLDAPAPETGTGFTGDLLHRLFHILNTNNLPFRFIIVDVNAPADFKLENYRDPSMKGALFTGCFLEKLEGYLGSPAETLGCRVVFLDFNMELPGTISVVSRNRWGGETATSHLIENGAKNIGYAGRPDHNYDLRMAGYLKALDRYGIPRDNKIIWMDVETALEDLSGSHDKIDALFCCSDFIAMRFINFFHKRGLDIPEDISIISYDDTSMALLSEPEITCISVNRQDMAEKAYLALTGKINELLVEAETRLIVRGSTKLL